MRCDEVREILPDYLTETLSPADRAAVHEHLLECVQCRQEFESVREFWQSLDQMAVPSHDGLQSRVAVMAALKRRTTMRAVLKAAAVIIVITGLSAGASFMLRPETAVESKVLGHAKGPAEAPITLLEYGDYECPPCVSVGYREMVARLLAKYPETIRYEYRHFPLTAIHPNSVLAARTAEAAGAQNKFWEMHEALRESHSRWARSADARPVFLELASQLGLDRAAFLLALDSPATEQAVVQQMEAGRSENIQGTPTVVLNGTRLSPTPRTFEEFDALVIDLLKTLKLQRRQLK